MFRLPVLQAHPDCTSCNLHEQAKSIGIASRPLFKPVGRDTAVLCVGEAPGRQEDEANMPFIGSAGIVVTDNYFGATDISEFADIYVGNACRCRAFATPTKGQIKQCRQHLHADILSLSKHYRKLVLFGVGATASKLLLNCNLAKALKQQGTAIEIEGQSIPCYFTFHPAALLPGRNPNAASSVHDHLSLLRAHLTGDMPDAPDFTPLEAPPPPIPFPRWLWLDIETYGAVEGFPQQTQFHPARCALIDNVGPREASRTVALSWIHKGQAHTACFVLRLPHHRRMLTRWLRRLAHSRAYLKNPGVSTLAGFNIAFDVLFLRANDPQFMQALRSHLIRLWDASITSYLDNEQRPERSLKSLAPLFGITRYDTDLRGGHRFASDLDPALHKYNAQDAWASMELHESLAKSIRERYPNTTKLSPECYKWYSDLIWSVLEMTETGLTYDLGKLKTVYRQQEEIMARTSQQFLSLTSTALHGKGSVEALTNLMQACARCAPPEVVDQIRLTDAKMLISADEQNRNLLRPHVTGVLAEALDAFSAFKTAQKLVSSYLKPLLNKHSGGSCRVYSSWYLTPSTMEGSDAEGGVKQGRLSAKSPPVQTDPPLIAACRSTRFCPGYLLRYDLSQIELRVAALLSGDAVMMAEYLAPSPNLHGRTAIEIFGDLLAENRCTPERWKDVYRQAGKRANFLMIYGGGAMRLHETLMGDLGFDYPIEMCAGAVARMRKIYAGLIAYQAENHRIAKEQGYLELPPFGASRLFIGGDRAVEETYLTEINNFPVQYYSAVIMQSAIMVIQQAFKDQRMAAVVVCQTHDSVDVECPLHEKMAVDSIVGAALKYPPFYGWLCKHLGRSLPLDYDAKVLLRR